jgi:hypothetical protein
MRRAKTLCVLVGLLACLSMPLNGREESSLSSRIIEGFKTKEPNWKEITSIESRVPLVPSEKRILTAAWVGPKLSGVPEVVDTSIYSVESLEQAADWLRFIRIGQVAPGWHARVYRIGDEGYLARYKDGTRFEIQFRSGKTVAKIAGNHLSRVAEFAKLIVGQIPTN